jgi:hypothetical protein
VPAVSEKKREDDKEDDKDESEDKSDKSEASDDEEESSEGEDTAEDEGDDDEPSKSDDEDDEDAEEEDDEDDEDAEEAAEPEVDASPEAIAKRVAAFGEEDEAEVIARQEEQKLAARRKKGRGKRGLQKAASKKLRKIAAKAPKRRRPVATAIEGADPLLERTARIGEWAQKNQKLVWGVAAVAVIGAAIFGSVTYLDRKKANEASVVLAQAVADERGRIGEEKEDEDPDRPKDLTPIFKTGEDRRESALKKYREVTAKFPGTGAAMLARLAEGSLLLDKREADPAASAFLDVKASPLAQADAEVRGRSLEGLGFAYELKAVLTPAEKDRYLDDAIKQFRELENTDVSGFKELGMYHQGRCYEAKGDKEKAKELLKSLHERLSQPGTPLHMTYLQNVTDDRLRVLDPLALPPKPAGMLGGPGGNKLSEAQIRALFEQLQQKQKQGQEEH